MKGSWGQVRVGRDAQGHLEAVLENHRLRVRYGLKYPKYPDDEVESVITDLVLQDAPQVNQAGHLMDAAAWRAPLTRAEIKQDTLSVKTVHLEWAGQRQYPGAAADVSIYPDGPFVRTDYLSWCVNVVDIGWPGGTRTAAEYVIYGADAWKRGQLLYPQVYFDRWPGDIGHENVTEVDDPGPLDYHGWFIMGVYNPANGIGYGQVVPVEAVDVIKLLKFERDGMGFELFPYFHRPHQPFRGYLYAVTGGAQEIISLGQRLADDI